jgi:hypothetical protein
VSANVIFPLIKDGSLFMSPIAASGRPQLATKCKLWRRRCMSGYRDPRNAIQVIINISQVECIGTVLRIKLRVTGGNLPEEIASPRHFFVWT